MDDWLSNTAGAGPGDGAFERFLTAALAAIITLVFSWRLLGEVSDSEREQAMRRYASSQATGQYSANQHGISNEKLKRVAETFAQDRSKRLNEKRANAEDGHDITGADGDSVGDDSLNIQRSMATEQSHGLSAEDSHFLSELLRSSLDGAGEGRENEPAGSASDQEIIQPELTAIQRTPPTMNTDCGDVSVECPRLTDTPACAQSVSDLKTQVIVGGQTVGYNLTADDDSDDEFQDYYDDDIEPRVLDSDEEFYYRTILEPIAEEVSGDEPSSSGDEWCDVQDITETDDNWTPSPGASPVHVRLNISPASSIETLVATDTSQPIREVEISSEVINSNNEELGISKVPGSGVSKARVFDVYQQMSPDHNAQSVSDNTGEITDDSVSEESDDTVIMVFSTHNRGEENGHQNEIIFLEDGNYGNYRDLLETEKIEDSDSDDDIMTHSKHYDQIRNNLTLIGSEDSDCIPAEFDDYDDRGSWSDPDDNFKFAKSSSSRYRDRLIDDFVKDSNENLTVLDDNSLSWKSLTKSGTRPFKLNIDNFEFGGKTPVRYDDAPFSDASEDSPIGFTFVEVKDSFTEFSLRNYVRDKDNFGPKSDSGIFTDSGEFLSSSNGEIKPSDSENEILTILDLNGETCFQNETNLLDNGGTECEQMENAPGDIDYDESRQYERSFPPETGSHSEDSARHTTDRSDHRDVNESALLAAEIPQITYKSEDSIASLTETEGKNRLESNERSDSGTDLLSQGHDSTQSMITRLDSDLGINGVNEALRLLDDSYISYLQTEMGPVEDKQTVVISCTEGETEHTLKTCSPEGSADLPRDNEDTSQHDNRNENERHVGGISSIKNDNSLSEVMIEALSPTSKESYYSERRRFNYQEALILESHGNQGTKTTTATKTVCGDSIGDYANVSDTNAVARGNNGDTCMSGVHISPDVRLPRTNRSTSKSPSLTSTHLPGIPEQLAHNTATDIMAINTHHQHGLGQAGKVKGWELEENITPEHSQLQSHYTWDCDSNVFGLPKSEENVNSTENSISKPTNVRDSNRHKSDSAVLDESPVICLVANTDTDCVEDNEFIKSESEIDEETTSPLQSSMTMMGSNHELIKTQPSHYTPSKTYESLLKPTTTRRYTSVLQRPMSSEKIHLDYRLPDKPVPKIRRKILASRFRFFSDEDLSPNDSFEEQFLERRATACSPDRDPHHVRQRTPSSPSNRQAYSVADISRLYSPTSKIHKPSIDQLHDNCILSPERLAFIKSRAFSTESLTRSACQRQPSVASLVETDIDTGETTETPLFTETDLDVPFRLQTPPEKTVSMMDLRSGSRSRFAAKKKAAEERKKSKSLQQLGVNIGSLETDIDAPFPCDESGVPRVPSVHELRVTRSLSKLNVPDWLKRSPIYRTGSSFILRRDSNASSISQWSSKSYGPLATRDSSRASSTVTLSQPSPVVIRTRVVTSSGRLVGSPKLGSISSPEPKQLKLPSAKFREKEKPSGLMPIPIVPFEELRKKFETKSTSNGHSTEALVEREIVVIQNAVDSKQVVPPGILKQTSPDSSNRTDAWPTDLDIKTINKSPPILRNRLPPPKITITAEKNVSPKDKTSPGAFEKNVRFSPVLNRMELSTGPNVTMQAPKSHEVKSTEQPINGGAAGKKPNLPPKPSRKLLKWYQSAPAKEEQTIVKPVATPKPIATPKPVATPNPVATPKPAPAEKPPSRIANLIRRFKGKDEYSSEIVAGVGTYANDSKSEGDVFFDFQKRRSKQYGVGGSELGKCKSSDDKDGGLPPPAQSTPETFFEQFSLSHDNREVDVSNTHNRQQSYSFHSSPAPSGQVTLDEVLGSLLALRMHKNNNCSGDGTENSHNTDSNGVASSSSTSNIETAV